MLPASRRGRVKVTSAHGLVSAKGFRLPLLFLAHAFRLAAGRATPLHGKTLSRSKGRSVRGLSWMRHTAGVTSLWTEGFHNPRYPTPPMYLRQTTAVLQKPPLPTKNPAWECPCGACLTANRREWVTSGPCVAPESCSQPYAFLLQPLSLFTLDSPANQPYRNKDGRKRAKKVMVGQRTRKRASVEDIESGACSPQEPALSEGDRVFRLALSPPPGSGI